MKRLLYQNLLAWKNRKNHKPLIIRGARQVGKTWLIREFGKANYKNVVYLNMESSPVIAHIFTTDFNIDRILLGLQIESGKQIDDETLLIFDEVQEAPQALTALKYFHENAPQYDIICAGSLLGVAMNRHTSFPVGKVEFLDLYPMNFQEFLLAVGESALVKLLQQKDWNLVNTFAPKLTEWLRYYYFVGGMPEVVNTFVNTKDLAQVRAVQRQILFAYEQDFSKHAPSDQVPRIRMAWNSVPSQLAKDNRKFIYGAVRQGARAKDFEIAFTWLEDAGLIHKIYNITKPAMPLKAYEDASSFKVFILDVGILGAMIGLDSRSILEGNAIFQEFKGALTEQYVLQQLITRKDLHIYYWAPGQSRAEVDFVIQRENEVWPLEVKAEENLQAKSLRVYVDKFQPHIAYRTSMSLYRQESWMVNLPLFAVSSI